MELKEDTRLNQVTLILKMMSAWLIGLQQLREQIIDNVVGSAAQVQKIAEILSNSIEMISTEKYEGIDAVLKGLAAYMASTPKVQVEGVAEVAQVLSDKMPDNEKLTYMVQNLADALKKSAEKSVESANNEISIKGFS